MNLDEKNKIDTILQITGSKSESNRILILANLLNGLQIENLSNSDDTILMQKALSCKDDVIDISMAGTTMRFMTSFLAIQEGREVTLTGCNRMKERPIKILVDALRELGADIEYLENQGYPPLKIKGRKFKGGMLNMEAVVSSQYITSILLIAPFLENGIEINLQGKISSLPYIKMTINILEELGIKTNFENHKIKVFPFEKLKTSVFKVESDWSSASYYYSLLALSKGGQIELNTYKNNSLQGDRAVVDIYQKYFGIDTIFKDDKILINKNKDFVLPKFIKLNLINTPDIAQTVAATCAGLKIKCKFVGLHTLKVKETDRLCALENELSKLGVCVKITNYSLELLDFQNLGKDKINIEVYNDHRMAMAFAPLNIKYLLNIKNKEVVSKSYPEYWKHLDKVLNL